MSPIPPSPLSWLSVSCFGPRPTPSPQRKRFCPDSEPKEKVRQFRGPRQSARHFRESKAQAARGRQPCARNSSRPKSEYLVENAGLADAALRADFAERADLALFAGEADTANGVRPGSKPHRRPARTRERSSSRPDALICDMSGAPFRCIRANEAGEQLRQWAACAVAALDRPDSLRPRPPRCLRIAA